MKRFILTLVVPITLGSAAFFTSCQEKSKPKEASAAKTTTTVPADTTTTEEISAPDSASTESADTAATEIAETKTSGGQKFGHVNSADLIKLMPETKRAEASLAAYVKTLEKQFGNLQSDYQRKIADYQAQEKTMVDAIKQTKIQAIQNLEQQMQESQMEGQQKVAAKREALFKPILDKAEKAVKAVGKENGYDYVFDTNSGAFIYSKDSHDVMPLVKKKLGIK